MLRGKVIPPSTAKKMETEVVSLYFLPTSNQKSCKDLSDDFLNLADELNISLEQFKLPATVHCVYNPTMYARITYEMYIKKYCNCKKRIMYFGMNPGPWGMSQTGVRLLLFLKIFIIFFSGYVPTSSFEVQPNFIVIYWA